MHLWLMWRQQRMDRVTETKIQSVTGTEKTRALVRNPLLHSLWGFGSPGLSTNSIGGSKEP